MRNIRTVVATLAIFTVAVSGAASAAPGQRSAKKPIGGSFPVTVKDSRGTVTVKKKPTRIVSLSPTATESLFAIGAGKQVVAVDDQSNYPTAAPKTKLSGFQPNLEAIIAYKPDLVVIANDVKELAAAIEKLKVPVLLQSSASSLDDVYSQIDVLGTATGHQAEAAKVVTTMRADIKKLTVSVSKRAKPLTYFHELDNTLYSVTSKTFVGTVYASAGLVNIADPADKDGFGFPQLANEFIVAQNPDFIFLADTKCCQQDAKAVAARPGWSALNAVKSGQVVALDDDIASRWGPRIVELYRSVITAVNKVPA